MEGERPTNLAVYMAFKDLRLDEITTKWLVHPRVMGYVVPMDLKVHLESREL
jgi:hypothetical protein